jgi:hypothetical protein
MTRLTVVDTVSRTANPSENFMIGVWAGTTMDLSNSAIQAARSSLDDLMDKLPNCYLIANPRNENPAK